MPVTRSQKIYFAVLLAQAAVVAVLGYFFPEKLDTAFSWAIVAPLHAGFIAAIYFFAVFLMMDCLTARDWNVVRWVLPLAVIWTGLLLIVSVIHWDNFDWDRLPVKIWLFAYFFDPLVAVWLIFERSDGWKISPSNLPKWARSYFLLQGGIFSLIGLISLILPSTMVKVWAWTLTPILAQIYAGPLLAYGFANLILAWQGTWLQVRTFVTAMLIFTAATLMVSYKYRSLFSKDDVSAWVWFGGFALATAMHLYLTFRTSRSEAS